jgi:hypothetical protein
MKASKVPAVRVASDGLVVKMGDKEYRPHAGEYVEVWPGTSWQFMRDSVEMTRLEGMTAESVVSADSTDQLISAIDRVCAFVASRVKGWTWTDKSGASLPAPTADVIAGLDQEEMQWLIGAVRLGKDPFDAEAEAKNA